MIIEMSNGQLVDFPDNLDPLTLKSQVRAVEDKLSSIPKEPKKVRKVWDALKAGVAGESLTGMGISAALGNKLEEVDPEGILPNIAYYGGGFLADTPLMAAATLAAPATGGSSLAALIKAKGLGEALKIGSRQALKEAAKQSAKRGAIAGAAYAGIRNPLESHVKDKEYNPLSHLLQTGAGAATGAVAAPLMETASGVISRPASSQAIKLSKELNKKQRLTNVLMQRATRQAREAELVNSNLHGSTKPTPTGFIQTRAPRYMEPTQAGGVTKLRTPEGKELAEELISKSFLERGLSIENIKGKVTIGQQLKTPTLRFDELDQKAGTNLSNTVQELFLNANEGSYKQEIIRGVLKQHAKVLKQNGVSGKDFWSMLGGKKEVPPELTAIVQEARKLENLMLKDSRKIGLDVGTIKGGTYLGSARRTRIPIKQDGSFTPERLPSTGKPLTEGTVTLAEHQSKQPNLPEASYIDDYFEFMSRWGSEINASHKLRVLPQVKHDYAKLKLMGLNAQAESVAKWYNSAIGQDKSRPIEATINLFTKDSMTKADAIANFLRFQSKDTMEDFLKVTQQSMFSSWVGANPVTLIKQILQPLQVGPAEIGPQWVLLGERYAIKPTAALNQLWNTRGKFLSAAQGIDVTELPDDIVPTNPILKTTSKVTKYIMKPFTALDTKNRKAMFFGGYSRAKSEGLTEQVLDGLLPTQRNWVLQGMTVGGIEEAAIRHGIVRSLRTNYMYSIADRPEALQGLIGNLIPFTTWSRNQWTLMLGDINNKNYKVLAKRLAYPLALSSMIATVTGQEIPSFQPIQSALGIGSTSILPQLGRPLSLLGEGNYKKAAKELGTAILPYNLIQRGLKIADKGPLQGIGLKETKLPNLPDMFKRYNRTRRNP